MKLQNLRKRPLLFSIILICILILLDQYAKLLAISHLKGKPSFVLIGGVLELSYLENTGAAFSSFEGKQVFLIILTVLVIFLLAWRCFTLPDSRRFTPMRLCMLLILGGAGGNLLDRLTRRYVVDFIYFVPINFPKFNVADIYITVGVALLAFLLFFYYTEEEFDRLFDFGKPIFGRRK